MSSESGRSNPHIIISGGPPRVADALRRRMIERGVPANEVTVSADIAPVMAIEAGAPPTERSGHVARQAEVDLELARRTAALWASAHRLVDLTYEQAESRYYDGRINQLEFEAYQTAWRRGGHHLGASTAAGAERPQEPEVERLVQAILTCPSDRSGKGSSSAPPPPPPPPAPFLAPRPPLEVEEPPDAEVVIAISPGSVPIPPEVLFPKRIRGPRRRMDGPSR